MTNNRIRAPDLARGSALLGIAVANAVTVWTTNINHPMPGHIGIIAHDSLWDKIAIMFGAMFAAMTWHLTAMAVKASARAELGMGPAMREWMEQAGRPGRVLWVFALVGLPFMAYLLVAGALALWRALRPGGAAGRRLAALSDFAMNFGMFWMSTGLLTPILPFFAALAF